ncbi:MAG TPA: hypothetical protein PKE47_06875, partial [Verrucomicrobiota bacterium]|nr:hypothetical protein [Verrucomicrobiota bacterium]
MRRCSTAGAAGAAEQLLHGHVELFVERRAAHRLEQAARREQRVGLRAPDLDLARLLTGREPPHDRAAGARARRDELELALDLTE